MEETIIEEINRLLVYKDNKENNNVSLYEIVKLMKANLKKYDKMIKSYESYFSNFINSKYNCNCNVIIQGFNYDKFELKISLLYLNDWLNVTFSKNDKILIIKESTNHKIKNILLELKTEIAKLYDEFFKYTEYFKQETYNVRSVNSKFLINISRHRISIFNKQKTNNLNKDFELYLPSDTDFYNLNCSSNNILCSLQGKEKRIFQKVFVKIKDCPEWTHKKLYKIREKQLAKK
ncbi:MAG: hypothetical protein HFI86_04930 [Bacilli bacterium]|nr:hypothetical protein [Bacilli bacterium]